MISSFDYYKQIESPEMYLCNPDQRHLCQITGEDRHMVLRFNDLSELTFTVPKIEGTENKYDLIQTKRLIYVEKIGWFQIVDVTEDDNGGVCVKSITAESHQTAFKDRGFVTEERVYMFYNPNDPLDDNYESSNLQAMPSVIGQLNKQLGIKVALNNDDIEPTEDKVEWTIIYIDPALRFNAQSYDEMYKAATGAENVCRSFEENTELFGYDFIINNVEQAFKVVFEFDILYHTIKVRKLEDITKSSDIYLSFDNLINSISVKESAENIVTVLTCNGNDLDIRTVNPMGTNYICNFDYYTKRVSDDGKIPYPWMSEELISALEDWKEEFKKWQTHDDTRNNHTRSYSELTLELQEFYMSKLESDNSIQISNLQLQNLFNARDQLLGKSRTTYTIDHAEDATEEWLGSAPIIVETIDEERISLDSSSKYHNKTFDQVTGNVTAYKAQPAISKIDGTTKFKYSFDGIESKTSSFDEMIAGYIEDSEETAMENVYLYFTDASNATTLKSYCKVNVKSVVDVSKDADGNIVKYTQNPEEDWSPKSGTVELRGVTFTISRASATGNISITSAGFSKTFLSNTYFICNGKRYQVNLSADGIVSIYAYYVSGFDRYTTYAELTGDTGWCSMWENYINNNLVSLSRELNNQIKTIEDEMAYINTQCNIQKFIIARGQNIYNELLNYWIEGSYTNDNLAVLDSTTMAERISLAKELMKTAEQDLIKNAQPQFEFSVAAVNFVKLLEFKEFTNQLTLGKKITIEKSEDILYEPALLSIEYNLDDSETFALTFSNASRLGDATMTYAELLKETSSISRTVTANWADLTAFTKNKDTIQNLIEAPLDRTLRAAQKNMAAQAFIVDETGILGRKYDDDSHTTFLPEQIRIINNTILFTQDNWETAALALGKIQYGDGQEAYGLVADVLVGNLMLSSQMVITNGDDDNSILLNDTGILIKHEGENVFVADTSGNLEITGIIHATGGDFKYCTIEEGCKINSCEINKCTIDKDCIINGFLTQEGCNEKALIGYNENRNPGFFIYREQEEYKSNGKYIPYLQFWSSAERNSVIEGLNSLVLGARELDKDHFFALRCTPGGGSLHGLWQTNDTTFGKINSQEGFYLLDNSGDKRCSFYKYGDGDTISAIINTDEGDDLYIDIGGDTRLRVSSEGGDLLGTWTADYVNTIGGTFLVDISYNKLCSFYTHDGKSIINTDNGKDFTISIGNTKRVTVTADGGNLNGTWYLNSSTAVTSDKNLKHDIEGLDDKYSLLFDGLTPVRFKYNDGTSDRYHTGLIAQDLKQAIENAGLDTKEFAGYVEKDKQCAIRYEELISLCINEIQKLKKEIKELRGD